jgi:hypothetical protein
VLRALGARVLPRLPVALLLAVAAGHFALARCCDLNPWLGGGFGMFSTVDERSVRAFRVGTDGEAPLAIPDELDDTADRCEALPRAPRLRALALALAELPEQGGASVRVEVWETHFAGPDLRPAPRRLNAASVDAAAAPR